MPAFTSERPKAPTVSVKAKLFATANASDGQIVHFDPAKHAEPEARTPTIALVDYRRFLQEGYIEPNEDAEDALRPAEGLFTPAGSQPLFTYDEVARIVDDMVTRRMAALAGADNSVDASTGLTHTGSIAYPRNQPVPTMDLVPADEGDDGDEDPDSPPADGAQPKRGRGRPRKVAAPDPTGEVEVPAEGGDAMDPPAES